MGYFGWVGVHGGVWHGALFWVGRCEWGKIEHNFGWVGVSGLFMGGWG